MTLCAWNISIPRCKKNASKGGNTITPRQVLVEFKTNKRIDVGVQGDHDTILLVCELPEDFATITCGDVDFLIDGKKKLKRHFSENQNSDIYLCGSTLYILLPHRYTSGTSLRIQVGGRTVDDGNKQLLWSPLSETIVFAKSIAAGYSCAHKATVACGAGCNGDNGCGGSLSDLIKDLVIDSHSHSNHEVLNQLSADEDGGLLMNGQPVGDGAAFRFPFAASDWLPAGPEEYRITIPLETHGKGPFAYISAANVENIDGDQENAVFGTRRTPRGDIIITSATPVAGEIFIKKGAN